MNKAQNHLSWSGADMRAVIITMLEAVQVTRDTGMRPSIEINGKVFADFDLVKVARLLPSEPLTPEHQALMDREFKKTQQTYIGAAANLATRANQLAADHSFRSRRGNTGADNMQEVQAAIGNRHTADNCPVADPAATAAAIVLAETRHLDRLGRDPTDAEVTRCDDLATVAYSTLATSSVGIVALTSLALDIESELLDPAIYRLLETIRSSAIGLVTAR